ncbi:TPA: glycosyltransferase family 2 protein [Escherichia coli]|nr:glycosyltransferase family 2 protein [Escherichia coli]
MGKIVSGSATNISVLVVLYGKEVNESETIKSLCQLDNQTFNLKIVNNGPKIILGISDPLIQKILRKGVNVNISEHLDNKPLSKVYNDFIDEYSASDFFIFLDDDTNVPADFLSYCKHPIDLNLPVIKDDGVVHYPKGNLKNKHKLSIISISSGLSLSNNLICKYKKEFIKVFDERFALYGIDTSFFARLQRFTNQGVIFKINIGPEIQHSLSKFNSDGKNKFRTIERTYDLGLTARFYPEAISYPRFILYIIRLFITFKFGLLQKLSVVMFKGKHPRC